MSITVRDPAGAEWTVSREWFGIPGWARDESPYLDLGGVDLPGGGWDVGDNAVVVIVIVVAAVVLFILALVLLPFIVLLLGVTAAVLALGARLLGVSAWTVRAHTEERALTWRVRGVLTSGRAMRRVAAMLERGEEPSIAGISGVPGPPTDSG